MSADDGSDAGPGSREIAYRPFAAEFDDASLSYSESDEERAPNYVVTPTGLRVNRLFAVGVLTEVEAINDETLRGRIVDPTGAFVTYAGQYQPEAQAFLDQTTPPAFVAITGKARTFEPEDSDRVFTSVRPESLSEVAADTRDRWVVSAAEATLHRIAVCAAARNSGLHGEALEDALTEAGVDTSLATGIPRALDHYGTTTAYLEALRQLAVEALELVADEREEVTALDLAPGEGGEADLGPLPEVDLDLSDEVPVADEGEPADKEPAPADEPEAAAEADEPASTEPTSTAGVGSDENALGDSTDSPAEPTVETGDTTDSTTGTVESAEPDSAATNGAADSAAAADASSTTDTAETTDETDQDDAEDPGMYQLDDEEREELESEYGSGFSTGNEVDPAGEADIDVPDADELAEQAEAEDTATDTVSNGAAAGSAADDDGGLGEFDDGVGDFQDTRDTPTDGTPTDDTTPDDATATDTTAADDSASAAEADATEPTPDTDSAELTTGDSTTEEPTDEATEATADTTDETESDSDASTDEPAAEDIDLEDTVVETMAEMDDGDGVGRDELVASVTDTYGVEATAVEEAIADALMGGRCYEPGDDRLKAI